jgi:hypothetical protein
MSAGGILSFWRGETPLATVFWEYAIAWGTLINLLCTGAALIVFVNDGPVWLGLLLHFAAIPLNTVLVISTWRAAARENETPLANFARGGILVWFAIMLVF